MRCKQLAHHLACPSSQRVGGLPDGSDNLEAGCRKDVTPQRRSPCLPCGCGTHSPARRESLSCSDDPPGLEHSPSRDSGYSSLLNISSPAAGQEGSLEPEGDGEAGVSPAGAGGRWDRRLGTEEEEGASPLVPCRSNAPESNGKPVSPAPGSQRPCNWHLLPALQVGMAACLSVGRAKGLHPAHHSPLKPALQGLAFSIDCLIGRKMGLEHVDIWKELSERGFPCILRRILRYLSAADLLCCVKVSKIWKKIICNDKRAHQALKKATRLQRADAAKRENVVSRGTLTSIQRQCPEFAQTDFSKFRPASQPKPGSDSQKSIRHQQVVKTLRQDELLKRCPLCGSPAKFRHCEERAVCTSESCAYDYCSLCLSSYHGSKACARHRFHSSSKTQPRVGSKRSKQNLQRL
ncbi:F-box only protein 5-like [Pristis pectinata]|uniref:F-box only protein 5-like n=1 Tax=Pristis pectinata TaxID=685728 RepID=UPI00223D6F8A|nr:F-box only protein 5-like [Pristis pectinata]